MVHLLLDAWTKGRQHSVSMFYAASTIVLASLLALYLLYQQSNGGSFFTLLSHCFSLTGYLPDWDRPSPPSLSVAVVTELCPACLSGTGGHCADLLPQMGIGCCIFRAWVIETQPILPAHLHLSLSSPGTKHQSRVLAGFLFGCITAHTPLKSSYSAMILVCTALSMHSDHMLSTKQGLPMFNQLAAWTILGASLLSAVRVSVYPRDNGKVALNLTMQVAIRLLPAMVLLSVSYEPLFLLSLARSITSLQSRPVSHLESATTLLLLLTASFFGLGNIASLAHFSLPSAFRFVTVFTVHNDCAPFAKDDFAPFTAFHVYRWQL